MFDEHVYERIRRAYYVESKNVNQIAQEEGYSRKVITKMVKQTAPQPYRLTRPRPSPVLGPYLTRIEELLLQNKQMPPTQRYTAHKVFEILQAEGYQGSESRVRQYIGDYKQATKKLQVFLPLEYDPGADAQVDWGEAIAVIAGHRQKVQFFLMRLCYSRRAFAMAFPSQAQESFLYAHVCAFKHFGGIPHRISYDNLGTAVKILPAEPGQRGRKRKEVRMFVSFRSHYFFESHFCLPGIEGAHEKGGVEHGIGYTRRQSMVPIPEATSFDDLNRQLLTRAFKEDSRRVAREKQTIGEAWEEERDHLYPLPPSDFECCDMAAVCLNAYSQAQFETNRYSVPVDLARRIVTLKAYPFHVEIWDQAALLASHSRCYAREQDVLDPLHYLPLLEQKPGALDFAKPIRRWKAVWPSSYNVLLQNGMERATICVHAVRLSLSEQDKKDMDVSHLQPTSGKSHAILPPYSTQASHIRYEAAQALVDAAPPSFGQEAILSGSTARGLADEDSDIEMVFYVEAFPSRSEREAWLHTVGAMDIIFELESSEDDQIWMSFVFREIWVEVGWQLLSIHEKRLRALVSGAVTAHGPLTLAWIMQNAISLRSVGLLNQWKQKLMYYPEILPQRILTEATHFWFFSHFFAVRWALIRRGEQLALLERLYQDTRNMLRILFAINHQWEPDWKWLRGELEHLTIKPEQLLERMDTIFLESNLEQRVASMLLLLRDVLKLVPEQYDVTRVRANVQASLRAHDMETSEG